MTSNRCECAYLVIFIVRTTEMYYNFNQGTKLGRLIFIMLSTNKAINNRFYARSNGCGCRYHHSRFCTFFSELNLNIHYKPLETSPYALSISLHVEVELVKRAVFAFLNHNKSNHPTLKL